MDAESSRDAVQTERSAVARLMPRGRMMRGGAGFVLFTAIGLVALFWFTDGGSVGEVVAGLSAGFLVLAVVSAVGDLFLDALRYQVFVRRIRPGTSIWLSFRTELANRFVGAITPSQTGGGPAQVFILWRGGIPVPDTLSFLLLNFLSTLIFFLVAGGLSAWAFRDRFPGGVHLLVEYGFITFAACLAVMLVGLLRPEWVARAAAAAARRLEGRTGTAGRAAHRVLASVADILDRYRAACVRFIREDPLLPVLSFALTVVLYLNKFTLGWLLVRGLGVHAHYLPTLAVQALLNFILYVAPSPGGSGIGELGTGALMTILLPTYLLAPFTLVYRLFTLYVPAACGSVVVLRALAPSVSTARPPTGVTHVSDPAGATPSSGVRARATTVRVGLVLMALLAVGKGQARAQMPVAVHVGVERSLVIAQAENAIRAFIVQGLEETDADRATASFATSVALARRLVTLTPDDPEAHYLLAVALGNYLEHQGLRTKLRIAGEVRREAERALELDPHHPGAHHVLGCLNAGAMRLNAIARLVAREVLGGSAMAGASWAQAEYHFREAWHYDPSSPLHPMELGALYIDTHRPRMARAVLTEAVRLHPTNPADSLAVIRAKKLLATLRPR